MCNDAAMNLKSSSTQPTSSNGAPTGMGSPLLPSRFWAKVDKTATCWLWTAAPDDKGYGRLKVSGKHLYAHRLSYEAFNGPIPDGLQIDHLCRVRSCVNPDHLEAITQAENVRRGLRGVLTTHCPKGHEYTPENTYVGHSRRYPNRMCRTCVRAATRAWAARTRSERRAQAVAS